MIINNFNKKIYIKERNSSMCKT